MFGARSDRSCGRLTALVAGFLTDRALMTAEEISRDGLWEQVVGHACSAGLGGAVVDQIAARGLAIPRAAAVQLDSYREHVAAATAYSMERAEPVLARLQRAGTSFLVLKGAALNTVLYDGPGLRPMMDVDLLIRPADAQRADEALRDWGCRPGPDLVNEDFYPRYYYEREYFLPCRPEVKIDLHVRPFRPLRYARTLPHDALWDHPTQARYGRLTVSIPNVENMLIHLAVHAACHGATELKWLYDLKLWVDRYGNQLDIGALADKCRRWKLVWPIRLALEQMARLFGVTSPHLESILKVLQSRRCGWRDRLVVAQSPRDANHPLLAIAVNMVCTPGVRFRAGYLRAVLLPARSHLAQLYPRRHPGWTVVAQTLRLARRVAAPFRGATTSTP